MSSTKIKISESDLIENFPFKEIRPKQLEGMKQIAQAINEGFKVIILEAPTGFGKSPVVLHWVEHWDQVTYVRLRKIYNLNMLRTFHS